MYQLSAVYVKLIIFGSMSGDTLHSMRTTHGDLARTVAVGCNVAVAGTAAAEYITVVALKMISWGARRTHGGLRSGYFRISSNDPFVGNKPGAEPKSSFSILFCVCGYLNRACCGTL